MASSRVSKMSTATKVGIGLGVAAVAVGVYYLVRRSSSTQAAPCDASPVPTEELVVKAKPEDKDMPVKPATVTTSAVDAGAVPPQVVDAAPVAVATRSVDAVPGGSPGQAPPAARSDEAGATGAGPRAVTREQLVEVLKTVHRHTQQLALSLAQRQQDAQERSSPMSHQELVGRFKRRSRQIQAAALDRVGMTQDEFDAALAAHGDHKDVHEQQEYLQQLTDAVTSGNGDLPEVPDDISLDAFLDKLEVFADAVELNVKESIAKALQSGLEGDALAQRITDLVLVNARAAESKALAAMGLTDVMFQACLQKYQFDSRVQDVFEDMNLNSAHLLQNAHPSIKSDEPQPSPARAIAGDREPDAEGPQ